MTREIKQHQKKIDDDVIFENCDVIAVFPALGQCRTIWKPDS